MSRLVSEAVIIMAASSSKGHSLNSILNSLEKANKQDCIDFSLGHLNENKLLKYASDSSFKSWASAHKAQVILTPKSELVRSTDSRKAKLPMQDALLKFSIGTDGTIPVPTKGLKKLKSRTSREKTQRQASYLDDGILIEEFVSKDPVEEYLPSPRVGDISPRISQDFGHAAITKRDQYLKRQLLETDLIRKQDARETNVLSGFKAVEHLENKLKRELDQLGLDDNSGPNFHRLQIYGNVFGDLISESTVFGPVLKTIKREYDDYTTYLLDSNPTQHQLLQQQIQQISTRKLTPDSEVIEGKQKLSTLEREAETLLAENKRLREALEREKRGDFTPQESTKPSKTSQQIRLSPRGRGVSDRVQDLRTSILEQLDEMQKIRQDLKQNYIPVSVVNQLDQCVKESEMENQNLMRRNEGLEKSIGEVLEGVAREVAAADTSESDERRIWRRLLPRQLAPPRGSAKSRDSSRASISSTRAMATPSGKSRGGKTPSHVTSDSDSEEEEDYKWNWYIS